MASVDGKMGGVTGVGCGRLRALHLVLLRVFKPSAAEIKPSFSHSS